MIYVLVIVGLLTGDKVGFVACPMPTQQICEQARLNLQRKLGEDPDTRALGAVCVPVEVKPIYHA